MRSGAAGANRDLGIRWREASQISHRRAVEDCGSGTLSKWTGGPRPKEGGESGAKSGVAQSQGDEWGGIQDTGGDGENI